MEFLTGIFSHKYFYRHFCASDKEENLMWWKKFLVEIDRVFIKSVKLVWK